MSNTHNTERRAREITETVCTQEGCQFNGQHAVQGVCYSDHGDLLEWEKIDAHEKELLEELATVRAANPDTEYIHWLEAMYISLMMNWQFSLDEVVRLRRDIALLKANK